jgi:hypothetical protein
MPLKKPSATPPKVMTWGKAIPVLVVCLVFDALRLFFDMFWFFGPAIATLYCTAKVSDTVGTFTGGALCGLVATAGGVAGFEVIAPFGIIMAIAVGLAGWMTIGLWLLLKNARIFEENAVWFASSLLVSEIPIVGGIPVLTGIVSKMYSTQIRKEQLELKKYEERHSAEIKREQEREALQQMQIQRLRAQEEAVNDAVYEQQEVEQEVANDARYTQEQDLAA